MGTISGNYVFKGIIGYTLQTYRVSPNYYNYFTVTMDSGIADDVHYSGTADLQIRFKTKGMDTYGNNTGIDYITSTPEMNAWRNYKYSFFVPPTRDIVSSEIIFHYFETSNVAYDNRPAVKLAGNFYFNNGYPNSYEGTFTKTIKPYGRTKNLTMKITRTAVNLYNIHLSIK